MEEERAACEKQAGEDKTHRMETGGRARRGRLDVGRAREHDNLSALREELGFAAAENAHEQSGTRPFHARSSAYDRLRQRFERAKDNRRQHGPPLVKTSAASVKRMNELRASNGDETTTKEKESTVSERTAEQELQKDEKVVDEKEHLPCPPTLVTYSRKDSAALATTRHNEGEHPVQQQQEQQQEQHRTQMLTWIPIPKKHKEESNFSKQAARGCFEFDEAEEIESTQEEVERRPTTCQRRCRTSQKPVVRPICLDTPDVIEVDEKDSETGLEVTQQQHQQQKFVCTFMKNTPQQISVTASDLERLDPDGELNDTLIDFYCTYLSTEIQDNEYLFCTTFLTKAVLSGDREKLSRWTRTLGDVRGKSFIVMPINNIAHWTVAIVCLKADVFADVSTPCILFFDSLGLTEIRFDAIRSWLTDLTGTVYTTVTMPVKVIRHLPRQENGTDCGVFVLQYIECFITRRPRTLSEIKEHWFSMAEIPEKREQLRHIIETVDKEGRATVHLPLFIDEEDSDEDISAAESEEQHSDGRKIFLEETPPSSLEPGSSCSDLVSEEEPPIKKQHTEEATQQPATVRQRRCIVSDSEDEGMS